MDSNQAILPWRTTSSVAPGISALLDIALEGGAELAEAFPGEPDRLGPPRGQHRRRRLRLSEWGEKEAVQQCRRQNRHSCPHVRSSLSR